MKSFESASLAQVKALAKITASKLKGGEILGLIGNLGSGKTTFTKYLAKALKVKPRVTSPTFVLMNLFKGRLKSGKKITLYHLDLYRTKNFREIKALGLAEIWGKKDTITVLEWADKIKRHLPKKTIKINLSGKR